MVNITSGNDKQSQVPQRLANAVQAVARRPTSYLQLIVPESVSVLEKLRPRHYLRRVWHTISPTARNLLSVASGSPGSWLHKGGSSRLVTRRVGIGFFSGLPLLSESRWCQVADLLEEERRNRKD